MDLEARKNYRKKVLGLTISENRKENGALSIHVHSTMLEDEVLYSEPLNSRRYDVLKEIFNGFGIASKL